MSVSASTMEPRLSYVEANLNFAHPDSEMRLLDETERRAAREQTLGRMTAEFARSLDIDTILQTVVRELGQTLAAAEITVQVGSPSGAIYPAKGEGEL